MYCYINFYIIVILKKLFNNSNNRNYFIMNIFETLYHIKFLFFVFIRFDSILLYYMIYNLNYSNKFYFSLALASRLSTKSSGFFSGIKITSGISFKLLII